MKNQACSVYERLSKNTFLSILGYSPYKRPSSYTENSFYFYKGKKITSVISSETYSPNITRSYFEKLNEKQIPWSITSFNPKTREVCIEIKAQSGLRELSVILPQLISKEV
jgi:hypothetical protein